MFISGIDKGDKLINSTFIFINRKGRVYVSDEMNPRVMKWMKEETGVVGGQETMREKERAFKNYDVLVD